jgi:hypothetical protein
MKKSLLSLIILFLLFSCNKDDENSLLTNNTEIAKIVGGDIIISNKSDIISKIENVEKQKKSDFKISKVYIDISKADDNDKIIMTQLIATNNDGSTKIAYLLKKIDNNYFIDETASKLECTGCRRGCNPRRDIDGDGWCTDCKITNSNCTKTETELTHAFQ